MTELPENGSHKYCTESIENGYGNVTIKHGMEIIE